MLRLTLRTLLYALAAFVIANLIWFGLLIFAISVLNEPTPECTDSDTCGTVGSFLFPFWPGVAVCLLLGAVIAWWLGKLIRQWNAPRPSRHD